MSGHHFAPFAKEDRDHPADDQHGVQKSVSVMGWGCISELKERVTFTSEKQ